MLFTSKLRRYTLWHEPAYWTSNMDLLGSLPSQMGRNTVIATLVHRTWVYRRPKNQHWSHRRWRWSWCLSVEWGSLGLPSAFQALWIVGIVWSIDGKISQPGKVFGIRFCFWTFGSECKQSALVPNLLQYPGSAGSVNRSAVLYQEFDVSSLCSYCQHRW